MAFHGFTYNGGINVVTQGINLLDADLRSITEGVLLHWTFGRLTEMVKAKLNVSHVTLGIRDSSGGIHQVHDSRTIEDVRKSFYEVRIYVIKG